MRKKLVFLTMMSICIIFMNRIILAAGSTPQKGDVFPDIRLAAPEKNAEQEYLGVKEKAPLKISHIKTDLLVIEIFSMYCPYCQKEAPIVNELFNIINKRDDLRNKIKIIGIGAGNTPFEVDVFRNQYNIPFPLFSDESFAVHKAVGEVRTPYFFAIRINPDGSNKIIYSKVGTIQDPNQFLDIIIKDSGLK